MKLIDNLPRWYRMYSTQALAFIVAVQGVLAAIPYEWTLVPVPFVGVSVQQMMVGLTLLAAVLGFIGRYVPQEA